ncbi:FAD-dependent oxidoreductase [Kineothrix sp. MB12-C1]|uniref:FAD-dependent oxidoreductase n=1 Tax=Kineothrix sp. MB12-C1 TaxID=3070215 RepID=UPI0027D31325|nr:FAD-dependent oxidoreductase [Kineothrix sp. MB12-C1]WMC92367.1 FAD-dependent oxidoreductase [Kineothrix sp. MB12-C1]
MEKNIINKSFDFVVVGGGMSGVCAAIAAARKGVRTALIHDRPVLGGNASSEIRMHICGADNHMEREDARETGILEEILLENKRRNPNMVYPIFDMVMWEKVNFQENLTAFLNCHMLDVYCKENKITSIKAVQMTTEKEFLIEAEIFMDATGDGTLGAKAGADFVIGREAEREYGETLAPAEGDTKVMGSSLMFSARDIGREVLFHRPEWAQRYTEEDLKYRDHEEISSGYWWNELGGVEFDTISDAELIKDELLKSLVGIWDHIKNGGTHNAECMELDWMGFLPAKRESRRLIGDYMLCQKDIEEGRIFSDAVAYGGWSMDLHTSDGIRNSEEVPTVWNKVENIYTIPYRSLYSRNINNLFLGGRAISCTHVAFSSTRVMGTCAVAGQAIGTAAAYAVKYHLPLREVGESIHVIQQQLIKDDCYIPGFVNEDSEDLAKRATVFANSSEEKYIPENIINGYTRKIGEEKNCWRAKVCREEKPIITLKLEEKVNIGEIRLIFDSNLSREITPSINTKVLERQVVGAPPELVKEFEITLFSDNEVCDRTKYSTKGQRLNIVKYDNENIYADSVAIKIIDTFGSEYANVFEVRIYNK